MQDPKELYAIILAGGSGTRFWPESRALRPKQLLPITGKKPMIVETVERLRPMVPANRTYIVTHESQARAVRKLLPKIPKENVLAEPVARNTAASIGWGATWIKTRAQNAVIAILPADHAIETKEQFQHDLSRAAHAASEGGLLTFGIRPSFPSTAYGYLEQAASSTTAGLPEMRKVVRFTEKPDRKTAESFLNKGNYYWNGGIFVWRKDAILSAIEQYLPQLHQGLQVLSAARKKKNFPAILRRVYRGFDSISIDYGVMEKAPNVFMLPASFAWSDVGSWSALDALMKKPGDPNVALFPNRGQFLQRDAHDCLAFSGSQHLIAAIGVKDLVIVHTPDATLVCAKDRAEEVKHLVEELQRAKRKDLL